MQADTLYQRAHAAQQQGDSRLASALLDQALKADPRHRPALLAAGHMALQRGDPAQAVALLTRLIKLEPRLADAYNSRGAAQLALHEADLALLNFNKVIELQPQADFGHSNRGLALMALHRPAEALASFDTALALRPGNALAHGNRGNALGRLHRWQDAMDAFEAALAIDPTLHLARWNIGMTQLRLGHTAEGWQNSEARLALFASQGWASGSAAPRWTGTEPIHGRTLLVHSEQGLGDTLQFARYIPLLSALGAQVVFEVQPPLQSLLSRALPQASVVSRGTALPPHDLQCPLLSLPLALGPDAHTPPPPLAIAPEPAALQTWQARLGPASRPRVGLVWSGNPQQTDDLYRSLPLQALAPLLRPEIEWFSLQKELRPTDREALAHSPVRHLGDELTSMDDTAALCAQMDLVISVCTSVAHLAGSMGKPLWVLLAHTADWRWLLDRHDSPWYPSARLWRQAQPGDWAGLMPALASALQSQLLGASALTPPAQPRPDPAPTPARASPPTSGSA